VASVTVRVPQGFPAGTTLGAYVDRVGDISSQGSVPVSTAVVQTDGTVTVTGLTPGIPYQVGAVIGGVWRSFLVEADSAATTPSEVNLTDSPYLADPTFGIDAAQALHDALASGAKRVVVPPGHYRVDSYVGGAPVGGGGNPRSVVYVTALANVDLYLSAGAVLETTLNADATTATLIEFRGGTNCRVCGPGKLVGPNHVIQDSSNANVRPAAVRLTNCVASHVSDVEITGFGYCGVYLTAGTRYSSVRRAYIHDHLGHGIVEDNFPATGAFVSTPPTGNKITGNNIVNVDRFGIAVDSPGEHTFTDVLANFIDTTTGLAGIKVNTGDTLVKGNGVRNTNWEGIQAILGSVQRLKIIDNDCVNCGTTLRGDISDYSPGIWVAASSTGVEPKDIEVEGNTINGPGKHGIYCLDVTSPKLDNNTIRGTQHSGHGVYVVYSTGGRGSQSVRGNKLSSIAGDAVIVTATGAGVTAWKGGNVSQNIINGCASGVNLAGLAANQILDYSVLGNVIVDPTQYGLNLDVTRCVAMGNIVDATSAVSALRSAGGFANRVYDVANFFNGTFSGGTRNDGSGQIKTLTLDPFGFGAGKASALPPTVFPLESGAQLRAVNSVIAPRKTQTLAANGAVTIDASLANYHDITLQANATSSTISFSVQSASDYIGMELSISWRQDGTGSRTYVWPSNCKFAGAAAPTPTTTANRADIVTFRFDGTNWNEISRSVGVG
jgi:hypothetical protein